jgi:hypothetical protein
MALKIEAVVVQDDVVRVVISELLAHTKMMSIVVVSCSVVSQIARCPFLVPCHPSIKKKNTIASAQASQQQH